VAGLLITDPLAEGIRATKDVDAIVEATSFGQYHQVEKRLPALGFNRDANSEVICRWKHSRTGVLFDLMPTDPTILGFSNRWYPEATETATRAQLSAGVEIRVISGPAFIATKLEAFTSRGGGDESGQGRNDFGLTDAIGHSNPWSAQAKIAPSTEPWHRRDVNRGSTTAPDPPASLATSTWAEMTGTGDLNAPLGSGVWAHARLSLCIR
jgi:hypothetical protein